MDTLAVVFLGVIALGSLAQGIFLISMMLSARQLARRIGEVHRKLDQDVRPAIDNLAKVTRNLAEVSDLTVAQAKRVDRFVGDTLDKVDQTSDRVRGLMVRPIEALQTPLAMLHAVQRAVEVYRQMGGFHAQRRGKGRTYADDEHLFI